MIVDINNINESKIIEIIKILTKIVKRISKLTTNQLNNLFKKYDNLDLNHKQYDKINKIINLFNTVNNRIEISKKVNLIHANNFNKCFKNYYKIKLLGEGDKGKVYLTEIYNKNHLRFKSQKKYAIKVQRIEISKLKDLYQEISILKKLSNLQIAPKFYDYWICFNNNNYYLFIVMDYLKYGTLNNWIESGHIITYDDIKKIDFKLNKMHKAGILHNDLHFGNIIIDFKNNNTDFYFIDFGLSKNLKKQNYNSFITERNELLQSLYNFEIIYYAVVIAISDSLISDDLLEILK
jgi:tRNA A-37 threonylcarbamoyl transferase component Bud32